MYILQQAAGSPQLLRGAAPAGDRLARGLSVLALLGVAAGAIWLKVAFTPKRQPTRRA